MQICFNISLIKDKKYWFLIVIACNYIKLIKNRKPFLDLWTKNIRDIVEKELALINPLLKFSLRYYFNILSLSWDMLYKKHYNKVFLFISDILEL